jgi:ankyrin repeat protein
VNAEGKDGMTLLLWAFPDNKLDRFKKLLEHGADPNVITKSDFNTHGGFHRGGGDSVTHMACRTEFPGYFEAVFDHGGDPNLIRDSSVKGETPLFSVITGAGPNKKAHLQTLIDKGADLNHTDSTGGTAAMYAVGWGGQFDIALMLLEAGADPKIYQSNEVQKLSHVVVRQESGHLKTATPQQKADYDKLVKWLEDHGESMDQARADLKRWASWNNATGESRRNLDAEIAERKAREAAEKKANADKQVRKQ